MVTPYAQGASARRRGKELRDNPYSQNTTAESRKFWEWMGGYTLTLGSINHESGPIDCPPRRGHGHS